MIDINYNELIERLRTESLYRDKATLEIMDLCMEAARAIIELTDRAIVLEQQLEGVLGDIERIRAEYGIDNADADEALAELCENYCANAGKLCYLEGEDHTCKNFKCQTRGRDIYFDRLFELIQADRDGRCVVLPCKAGDIVYSMFPFCGVNSHEIRRIEISKEGCFACSALMIPFSDFGKTVFLTREAAEEAMKERENNG